MLRVLSAASVALLLTGCAHQPPSASQHQVNRAAKSDKYAASKAPHVEQPMPTPNQIVKKRWFGGWRFFH